MREQVDELENAVERRRESEARTVRAISVNEPLPYRHGTSFIRDAWLASNGDVEARQRLERAWRADEQWRAERGIERRDVTSSNLGGLVIPAYLIDLFAGYARAGRPVADALLSPVPLPTEGMSVVFGRVTAGSTAGGVNESSGTASETSFNSEEVSVPVVTVAGMQDVSRASLERGAFVEGQLFADLLAAYNTELDRQVLAGSGVNEHVGLLNLTGTTTITYTDTNPSVPELWPKILEAVAAVESSIYGPADAIIMHTRRWAWIRSARDASGRPLFDPVAGQNVAAAGQPSGYGRDVGTFAGIPVFTDGNVPTNLGAGSNEDAILVVAKRELPLLEDETSPMILRFEGSPDPLKVRLVAAGYSAFGAARQPGAVAKIVGTGLVTPTFA